jgi:hypothetical protein
MAQAIRRLMQETPQDYQAHARLYDRSRWHDMADGRLRLSRRFHSRVGHRYLDMPGAALTLRGRRVVDGIDGVETGTLRRRVGGHGAWRDCGRSRRSKSIIPTNNEFF